MTGSLPADVTVHVREDSARTRIEFRARNGTPPLKVSLPGKGVLDEARRQLDTGLQRLKDTAPELHVPEAELSAVFDSLRRIGLRLLFLLFDLKVVNELERFWTSAVPFARNPGLPPPLVECVGGRDAFLPLEILPLFRLAPNEVTDRESFVAACRSLVGFSCMVKRTMPLPQPPGLELVTTPEGRVPVRFLHYEHLAGARKELAWFSSTAAHRVELEGPYPVADPGAPSLAEQIYDPKLLLNGRHGGSDHSRRKTPDQVQHFACHCYANADDPLENEVELSGDGRAVRVTLGELGEDLVTAARDERADEQLPLVVMNACGAARMHATSSLSFPFLFLKNRNRGFVGSDVEVPDDVAAAFSQALYEPFLLRGLPLGRSLMEARNSLLHTFNNPLGIVYSAYADPQLRLCPKTMKDAYDAARAV
ncbi:CHAT domain-containing protein [Streptomyces sp. 3N207]|uniref:CHAT domain-containing protein n=1 Tax=Streptomyces sp. 3N207 TaxID=3457417 RepID=UPI003FD35D50